MRTITIKLAPEADFSSEMAGMREWLDTHRCAPTRFTYDLAQDNVIIQVEFNKEGEVESSSDILIQKRQFGQLRTATNAGTDGVSRPP
jgi:hypothetical protein